MSSCLSLRNHHQPIDNVKHAVVLSAAHTINLLSQVIVILTVETPFFIFSGLKGNDFVDGRESTLWWMTRGFCSDQRPLRFFFFFAFLAHLAQLSLQDFVVIVDLVTTELFPTEIICTFLYQHGRAP